MEAKLSFSERRDQTIAKNKTKMDELGVAPLVKEDKKAAKASGGAKRKRAAAEPTRRSARTRKETERFSPPTTEDGPTQAGSGEGEGGSASEEEYSPPEPARHTKPSYDPTDGARDKQGRLIFADAPRFRPNLTPRQMLLAGMIGGCYFHPRGGKPGIKFPKGIPGVTISEYPKAWFKGVDESMYRSRKYNKPTNKYKVKAGQDQVAWESSGWINKQDPRGWIQWYFRFFTGRRTADDDRQIGRWDRCTGQKGRWKNALCKKVLTQNKRFDDASVSPVIRQTLLHWAYELTEADFQRYRKTH